MRRLALVALLLASTGCIPYAVGSTAQPLPAGESRSAMTMYRIPRGIDMWGSDSTDADNAPLTGIDLELRRGFGEGMDFGLRIPSASGVVGTVKRRLAGGDDGGDAALSIMPGLGVVNWLDHGLAELTLMGSTPRHRGVTGYAGLRAVQTIPLGSGAVSDTPTAGGYVGARFGGDRGGLLAEVGIYHDESALGLRRRSTIVVPSITFDGDLLDLLRDAGVFRRLRRR